MRKIFQLMLMAIVAIGIVGCDKEPATTVEKPQIAIGEVTFSADTMKAKVMIAPSTDAAAWYWRVEGGSDTLDETFTKVEGAAAREVEFAVVYGVEYTIKAYAENKAGQSEIAEKKYCAIPDGEVTIAIGDITIDSDGKVSTTIYPSSITTEWYWMAYNKEGETADEWNEVEGNTEHTIELPYEWNQTYVLKVYAACGEVKGDEVSEEYSFDIAGASIAVSKPMFDDATMTVRFEVTPSETTHHWFWGLKDHMELIEGGEATVVEYSGIEYDKSYTFEFEAANCFNVTKGRVTVGFKALSEIADISIESLTAFTVNAVVRKKEHCVRYVAGAVHTSAFDRESFIEQAQSSLDPDPSYPFVAFNSSTESQIFSEQNLVRNSLKNSYENAGLILTPGTSYTVAVYGEDAVGNYGVVTKEFVAPAAEINGNVAIEIEAVNVTETSAEAQVTAAGECKVIIGHIDPEVAKVDTDNPFDFATKTEAEIKNYIVTTAQAVPSIYTESITRPLSNRLEIDHEYYAFAIAIKDGKVGEVAYTTFKTLRSSLTGVAKITAAEIEAQTSHETLTVKVTPDANATKVRVYAAPSADHTAYRDNLEYVMDADGYQNYREEYEIVEGVATAVIDIYHPGDNYYIYASAVDASGRAGEMVCVAELAGLNTEYYTTMEEVVEEGSLSYSGTGSAKMNVELVSEDGDTYNVKLWASDYSSNVSKVWFMRFANCLTKDITSRVKQSLAEYATTKKPKGSYKEVKEDWKYDYITDTTNSFNPTYNGLLKYDDTYGGDIIVMVILDSAGKVKIHSYYAAGIGIVEM